DADFDEPTATACAPSLRHVKYRHVSDARLHGRLRRGEGRPVVLADEEHSRLTHRAEVNGARLVQRVARPEGRRDALVENAIAIGLPLRVVARVKVVLCYLNFKNTEVA